jgi:2-isopropylmalate synthase
MPQDRTDDASQDRLYFFDTTLRDGEQSPGCSMRHDEKLQMARQLSDLGVDLLEAGFPISSAGDFAAVVAISREITDGPVIAGLARCREEDINTVARALESAKRKRIHVFLASSDIHLEYKLKMSRQQAIDQTGKSVAHARQHADDIEFSAEDATRSDLDFLVQMINVAVENGANTINIPDTVGYTTPDEFGTIIRTLRERVTNSDKIIFSAHCHDDLGLAVANSLAAVEAGARQVECTINGIGERAGNAALEEIATLVRVRSDRYPVSCTIRHELLYPSSQLLSSFISFSPSANKAVVGANAFAHEAGIHQHGMLANPLCYEIMTPASVGQPCNRMVLGKHSGRHALAYRMAELGYKVEGPELDTLYLRFTELADRKKNVYDQDLISLLGTRAGHQAAPVFVPPATASEKTPAQTNA